jgi:GDP-mannose 6-dehydrogenase
MKVAVFGLGYVGTVTAAGLAAVGHEVVGVDVDPVKVATVTVGDSPVVEPGLTELVRAGVESGRLSATTSAADALDRAEVSLLCVGTPSGAQGQTDLRYLDAVLAEIAAALPQVSPPEGGHHAVVVRSTVPPGTGEGHVAPVFAEPPAGWSIGTAMCPEFLREGCAVADFFAPPFVVLGTADHETRATLERLFAFLTNRPRPVGLHHTTIPTAEALKYACNAFHATKVSFANELARIFRGYGVDSREVMEVFCADTKLNIAASYLRPGFAYGGSCLPKDLRSLQHLARTLGVDAPLLAGTAQTNELVIRDVVERVIDSGAHRVALLGLSFKSDTDDLRESPSVELAERLIGKGFEVRIYDRIVNPDRLSGANLRHVQERLPHLNALLAADPVDALADAEVVLVADAALTITAAVVAANPAYVIDLHGGLGTAVESLTGYTGVGW